MHRYCNIADYLDTYSSTITNLLLSTQFDHYTSPLYSTAYGVPVRMSHIRGRSHFAQITGHNRAQMKTNVCDMY